MHYIIEKRRYTNIVYLQDIACINTSARNWPREQYNTYKQAKCEEQAAASDASSLLNTLSTTPLICTFIAINHYQHSVRNSLCINVWTLNAYTAQSDVSNLRILWQPTRRMQPDMTKV